MVQQNIFQTGKLTVTRTKYYLGKRHNIGNIAMFFKTRKHIFVSRFSMFYFVQRVDSVDNNI